MGPEGVDALYNRTSNFRHPKIHPARELRLVTLQSAKSDDRYAYTFTVMSFADLLTTKYYALSYTWGLATKEDDIEMISVDGQDFWIRRKLFDFTKAAFESSTAELNGAISLNPTIPIFIDAICINQLDAHEKSFQVMQMANIYRHATQVVTYLGHPPCEDAEFANEIACRLAIFNSKLIDGPMMTISGGPFTMSPLDVADVEVRTQFTQEDLFILSIICRDIYWTRLWIVPEILLAPQHWVVWCGTQLFDGHLLATNLPFLAQRELHLRMLQAQGTKPTDPSAWRGWFQSASREAKAALHDAVDSLGGRHGRELLATRYVQAWQPSSPGPSPGDLINRTGSALVNRATPGSMSLRRALQVFRDKRCFDPRDKLYGLLPLLTPSARALICVDYAQDEVYVFEQALRIVWEEMSTPSELRSTVLNGTNPALDCLDQYDDLLTLFSIKQGQQMARARLVARKVARKVGLRRRWQIVRDQFVTMDSSVEDVDLHFDFLEWGCTLGDIRAKLGGQAMNFARVHEAMKLCIADAVAALRYPSGSRLLAIRESTARNGPRL